MENPVERETALNSTVIRLGLVAFLADISSEMLYPITPIFLTAVLGASFTSVGVIEGIAEGLASLLKVFSGILSDRVGRVRWLVAIGYLISAIAKPLIGSAEGWSRVLFARSLDRLGKGVRTAPRDVWLAGSVPASMRGAAFGWHRGMDSLGAFLGPLIALIFITQGTDHLRQAYYWAVIPGLLAVAMVFATREPAAAARVSRSTAVGIRYLSIWKVPGTFAFKRYLFVWAVFAVVNSSDAFLLLKASREGLSLTKVTLLYCMYNAVYAVASPWLGGLSDRFGRKPILAAGFLIFAVTYFGYAFASETWQFGALFLIYGAYMAATDGIGKAMAVDLLPEEARGTGLGWHGFVTGLAAIVASVSAGFLWDHAGSAWPFLYGASGALVAAALLILV